MNVVETERLALRRFSPEDAGFVVDLLNDPSFLRYIGDRGVRTGEDAEAYLRKGPLASYGAHGFGLWCVVRKEDGASIGMCGLLKRDALPDPDVGFAFLPAFRGKGYALEAAAAAVEQGEAAFGLERILAITHPGNHASIRLLEKLGFVFREVTRLTPDADEVRLFARDLRGRFLASEAGSEGVHG